MADDCLVSFKFLDKDDFNNDASIEDIAATMFSEAVSDSSAEILGAKSKDAAASNMEAFDRSADLEDSDFTEGFEFVF